MLKLVIKSILDIIYPNSDLCIVCDNLLLNEGDVCDSCKEGIVLNSTVWYLDDKREYQQLTIKRWQEIASGDKTLYFHNVSYYSKNIKELIYKMKFNRNFAAIEFLADMLHDYCKKISYIPDVITFVPMNEKKEKKKGYNHGELLARTFAKKIQVPCIKLLSKNKVTKDQKTLPKEERWTNLKGAIRENKRYIKKATGKKILIVDDVITSGASVYYCKKVLEKYTDESIMVLTASRSSI